MKKSHVLILLLCLFSTIDFGCATFVNDEHHELTIDSKPRRVPFTIYDRNGEVVYEDTTPSGVMLSPGKPYFRKATYTIVFRPEGTAQMTSKVTARLSNFFIFGNLAGVFYAPILYLLDPLSGRIWELSPDHVSVQIDEAQGFDAKSVR